MNASADGLAKRLEQYDSFPKPMLSERHIRDAKLVPDRIELLKLLPKHGRVAELGVAQGDFSKEIWEIMRPAHLDLVDLWESERYARGRQKVETYFRETITSGNVCLHQQKSIDFLKALPPASMDFIYIDTTHSFHTTLGELRHAKHALSSDGLIGGHDYCVGNPVAPHVYGVIQAVAVFCLEEDFAFKYLTMQSDGFNSFVLVRLQADHN